MGEFENAADSEYLEIAKGNYITYCQVFNSYLYADLKPKAFEIILVAKGCSIGWLNAAYTVME